MDYNLSIPDIYNSVLDYKKNTKDINILEYEIKPYQEIKLPIEDMFYYIYIQTDSLSLQLNNDLIWNNQIYIGDFINKKYHKRYKLLNLSDISCYIKLYIIYNFKLYVNEVCYSYYKQYEDDYSKISLVTHYCGISFANYIYIKTKKIIRKDIIKINTFNLILYYKVKKIYNNDNNYIYSLDFHGIENTLYNDLIKFDMIYNIYDSYKIINTNLESLKRFMENNKKYIIDNNIDLPVEMRDMDGWKVNMFYNIDYKEFTKKYYIYQLYVYDVKISD